MYLHSVVYTIYMQVMSNLHTHTFSMITLESPESFFTYILPPFHLSWVYLSFWTLKEIICFIYKTIDKLIYMHFQMQKVQAIVFLHQSEVELTGDLSIYILSNVNTKRVQLKYHFQSTFI